MPGLTNRSLYGVIALLIAILLVTASLSMYFYFQYNQELQANNNLTAELQSSTSKYNSTATQFNQLALRFNALEENYNGSLASFETIASAYNESVLQFDLLSKAYLSLAKQYNLTFSLLTSAVAELNTTEPAYVNASRSLTQLWHEYTDLVADYSMIVSNYSKIFSNFNSVLTKFEAENNITLNNNYQTVIQPVPLSLLTADILIDFGNGTYVWYNNTSVQPGWNFYVATLVVTNGNVSATWYPQYSEHYVTGIDSVQNTQTKFWFVWTYNATSSSWQTPQAGADELVMYNGSSYAWTFCGMNSSTYAPTCTPS